MTAFAIDHVALQVQRLRETEVYYGTLFGMDVAYREARVEGEWRTLPPEASWADADAAGIELELCMLERGAFLLALVLDPGTGPGSLLDHISVCVDNAATLDRIRSFTGEMGCRIKDDSPTLLLFVDRYGVHWEIGLPFDGTQRDRSAGAQSGKWIELKNH